MRSVVGSCPCTRSRRPAATLDKLPRVRKRIEWFLANRPELAGVARSTLAARTTAASSRSSTPTACAGILRRVLDENEFLTTARHSHAVTPSQRSIRTSSASRAANFGCDYEPAESTSGLFGGNSNWRGNRVVSAERPADRSAAEVSTTTWARRTRSSFPTGSGEMLTLWEDLAGSPARRLVGLFRRDAIRAARSSTGDVDVFQIRTRTGAIRSCFTNTSDGDTGEGLGASHRTGWTGLVAKLIDQLAAYSDRTQP